MQGDQKKMRPLHLGLRRRQLAERCKISCRLFRNALPGRTIIEPELNMPVNWRERIESNPGILGGKPRIKGTRIPASLILGYLAAGASAEQVIEQYPDLTTDDVMACLDFARDLAEYQVVA